jgi:hypothetical protein
MVNSSKVSTRPSRVTLLKADVWSSLTAKVRKNGLWLNPLLMSATSRIWGSRVIWCSKPIYSAPFFPLTCTNFRSKQQVYTTLILVVTYLLLWKLEQWWSSKRKFGKTPISQIKLIRWSIRLLNKSSALINPYHSKCLDPWYGPTEELVGLYLRWYWASESWTAIFEFSLECEITLARWGNLCVTVIVLLLIVAWVKRKKAKQEFVWTGVRIWISSHFR